MRFISHFIVITPAMTAAALAAGLALTGCDQQTQQDVKERASEAQDKAAEGLQAGKEKAEALGADAQQMWESLKTEYAPQVDALSSKVASLKEQAAHFKDTQLDDYIAQLDVKVTQIKAKLSESFSTEGVQSLKDNVSQWIDEAKALYDKAAARLAELNKSATGG